MASRELAELTQQAGSEPAPKAPRLEPPLTPAVASAQADADMGQGAASSKGGGKGLSEAKLELLMQIAERLENRLREVAGTTYDQDKQKPGARGSLHLHVFVGFSPAVPYLSLPNGADDGIKARLVALLSAFRYLLELPMEHVALEVQAFRVADLDAKKEAPQRTGVVSRILGRVAVCPESVEQDEAALTPLIQAKTFFFLGCAGARGGEDQGPVRGRRAGRGRGQGLAGEGGALHRAVLDGQREVAGQGTARQQCRRAREDAE